MTYEEAISYIYSFVDYEKLSSPSYDKKERSPTLFKEFLKGIGSPEEGFPVIHITGTKGKGSVAVMLTYIFKEAGFKVGTYTSPHLIDVRERIMLNGSPIEKKDFLRIFLEILPLIEKRKESRSYRTVFEILTAISFLYFRYNNVDIAVVEVGLGGRLDATNVFQESTSVFTNISLDHTKILGNTLKEISEDKSGIIKPYSLVVSSPQREEVLSIIKGRAIDKRCKFLYTGDYEYSIEKMDETGSVFDLKTDKREYKNLKLSLPGRFQIENALTAIGVVECLIERKAYVQMFEHLNTTLIKNAIYRGFGSIKWRGRLEVLRRSPYLVVDGAHNVYSMEVLAREIKELFDYKKLILIFGVNRDKNIKGMLDAILPVSDEIVLTKIDFPRSAEPVFLKNIIKNKSPRLSGDVKGALEIAYGIASEQDLILVTGSLYLVGEAIRAVGGQ